MKKILNASFGCLLALCLLGSGTFSPIQAETVQKKESFQVGKQAFLLNGKPFIIKAAEIHYPRIPEPYWEHRILLCKALGMNTICLYVFWNLHETEPDEFDFSGNKDIAKFCRLAQKHGMYVIVRPGPYVCAEWEMGGLPWWLLKKKDVQLRTLDTYYMSRVEKFMKEVGKQLSGQQITKGGNIIMVQVENEYGSYATDKPYVSAIRDIVRKSGFTEVPLFQCDWSSNFMNNALDDLLWTVNFGTGANIDAQFKKLKEVRPDSPLMCSEFWSGWFDHWGRKHETRDASTMVSGIKDMLDRNISFSLYMTHGGTTFGWWGGANNPPYSAMCSSYDYDAPISEAGWTTPKYYQLRELLQHYLPEGEKLPEPPAAIPVISIPAITEWKSAPLFDNLPEPKLSDAILPMEDLGQGWGTILYRTTLDTDIEDTLYIDEVHDWAQVFADGKLLGRMDRRRGEFSLPLTGKISKGTRLDILVEAMGRVNFDKSIHDRKGITHSVEAMARGRKTPLNNWKIYNLPPFYDFVADKHYQSQRSVSSPAYYKATFTLDKVGDTFLDMQTWGKGMVWVNGHALGRFWEIGPQQTLFMPGCWLKKGKNEIIVLDLKGPSQTVVRGLQQPILDMLRKEQIHSGRVNKNDLKVEKLETAHRGTFKKANGWQEVKFAGVKSGRYFCLETLSGFGTDKQTAIAELDVLDKSGKPVSREKWQIVYADSEETEGGNYTAEKVFDLQESTYWLTKKDLAFPHCIIIDLGKQYEIGGFRMLPRAEKGTPSVPENYQVRVGNTVK